MGFTWFAGFALVAVILWVAVTEWREYRAGQRRSPPTEPHDTQTEEWLDRQW